MKSARAMVEADLATTLEGDFASVDALGNGRITLISPDNDVQTGIKGRIDYDYVRMTPEGEPVPVHDPIVIVRKSSLTRVPVAGEKWIIRMPVGPFPTDPIVDFKLSSTDPVQGGETIGFLKMYPKRLVQS